MIQQKILKARYCIVKVLRSKSIRKYSHALKFQFWCFILFYFSIRFLPLYKIEMEEWLSQIDLSTQEQENTLLSYKIKQLQEKTLRQSSLDTKLKINRLYDSKDIVVERQDGQRASQIRRIVQLEYSLTKSSSLGLKIQKSEPIKMNTQSLGNNKFLVHLERKTQTLRSTKKRERKIRQSSPGFKFIKTSTRSSDRSSSIYEPYIVSLSQIDGQGQLILDNRRIIDADWVEGNPCGSVKIRYENKNIYIGPVYDLKPHGTGQIIFSSGKRYVGEFCDGQLHGEGVVYSSGGIIIRQGEWKRGKFVR